MNLYTRPTAHSGTHYCQRRTEEQHYHDATKEVVETRAILSLPLVAWTLKFPLCAHISYVRSSVHISHNTTDRWIVVAVQSHCRQQKQERILLAQVLRWSYWANRVVARTYVPHAERFLPAFIIQQLNNGIVVGVNRVCCQIIVAKTCANFYTIIYQHDASALIFEDVACLGQQMKDMATRSSSQLDMMRWWMEQVVVLSFSSTSSSSVSEGSTRNRLTETEGNIKF